MKKARTQVPDSSLPTNQRIFSNCPTILRIETGTMSCYFQFALSAAICMVLNVASSSALVQHTKMTLPMKRVGLRGLEERLLPFSETVYGESHDLDLLAISSSLFLRCNDAFLEEYLAGLSGMDEDESCVGAPSKLRADVKLMPDPISRPDGSNATVFLSRSGGFDLSSRPLNVSVSMLSIQLPEAQDSFLQGGCDETSVESLINACLAQYDVSMQYIFSAFAVNNGATQEKAIERYDARTAKRMNIGPPVCSIRTTNIHRRNFQEVLILEDMKGGGARIFHSSFRLLTRSSLPEDLRGNPMFGSLNQTGICRIFLATP
jgi:hypothetical protein